MVDIEGVKTTLKVGGAKQISQKLLKISFLYKLIVKFVFNKINIVLHK